MYKVSLALFYISFGNYVELRDEGHPKINHFGDYLFGRLTCISPQKFELERKK